MYKIPDKTVFIGKKIISLPTCESTNSLMMSMAQSHWIDEGTVIITEDQTGGRGQAGNRWLVQPGANLTFTVLLKPSSIEPSQQFYLNIAVGLAVCDALTNLFTKLGQSEFNQSHENHIKVKWPNDVMVGDKKVCGILIENQVQGQQLTQAVVGIGLNVNQKLFEWPHASSLSVCLGFDFDKADLLEVLLIKLDARYRQLLRHEFQQLTSDYYGVMYWKGERHEFQSSERIFTGVIEGIDEVGRLLVLVLDEVLKFNFKDIKFLR